MIEVPELEYNALASFDTEAILEAEILRLNEKTKFPKVRK